MKNLKLHLGRKRNQKSSYIEIDSQVCQRYQLGGD